MDRNYFWAILGALLLLQFSFEIGYRLGRAEMTKELMEQKAVDSAISYLGEDDAGKS